METKEKILEEFFDTNYMTGERPNMNKVWLSQALDRVEKEAYERGRREAGQNGRTWENLPEREKAGWCKQCREEATNGSIIFMDGECRIHSSAPSNQEN